MTEEQQSQATQADAKDKTQATTPAVAIPTETSAESQEIMIPKHRYDEVSNKLKAMEAAAAKAAADQQAAEEKRMQEQNQWRELAEERGKQLEGVKGKAADYEKLSALVSKQLETEINGWPEKVKNLFPTDEMPVLEMLEWAERFRPLALEMAGDNAPPPGNGPRPRPVSQANVAKAAEQQQSEWSKRARVRYR